MTDTQPSDADASANRDIVIFDLDGTLALVDHRRHFVERKPQRWREFYAACTDDTLNVAVAALWHALEKDGRRLWIVSGRSDEVKRQTRAWLARYGLHPATLLMRRADDRTPDDKLKRSWLRDGTIPKRRVLCVFDDRASVVAMWRSEGLPCLQVAPGDF